MRRMGSCKLKGKRPPAEEIHVFVIYGGSRSLTDLNVALVIADQTKELVILSSIFCSCLRQIVYRAPRILSLSLARGCDYEIC